MNNEPEKKRSEEAEKKTVRKAKRKEEKRGRMTKIRIIYKKEMATHYSILALDYRPWSLKELGTTEQLTHM